MSDYTLYLGDCLDYMRTMEPGSVDAIVTDFPYGNNTEYSSYNDTQENLINLINSALHEFMRISKNIAITCGVINQWLYPKPDWVIAWIAEGNINSSSWGFSCWQPILIYGKDPFLSSGYGRRPDIIKFQTNKNIEGAKEYHGHPCSKPVKLMTKIIGRVSKENNVIFDPFMGSGTTGVAALQLGRRFIGCEIDPGYFAIAEKRIKQAAAQMLLPLEIGA